MACILIGGFEKLAGHRLADSLRTRQHTVDAWACETHAFKDFATRGSEVDLVILDISRDDSFTRSILAHAIQLRLETGLRPIVLCVSRVYRGPRFDYELERKGVHLVHVG